MECCKIIENINFGDFIKNSTTFNNGDYLPRFKYLIYDIHTAVTRSKTDYNAASGNGNWYYEYSHISNWNVSPVADMNAIFNQAQF